MSMEIADPARGAPLESPPLGFQPKAASLEESPLFRDSEDSGPALISFYEKISEVSNIGEFLLFLHRQIPKKLKAGELILFYVSPQFGLRRAYVKKGRIYEEMAKTPWPLASELQYGDKALSFYMAKEMGRPFFDMLMAPFPEISQPSFDKSLSPALFVELRDSQPREKDGLKAFFQKRLFVLRLILRRALLNTSSSRTSYLWSQVFGGWSEPLAILHKGRELRSNRSFDEALSFCPELADLERAPKDGEDLLSVRGKIYQRRRYPISSLPHIEGAVFLYCQDMTKHFRLREKLLQSEKMAALARLGRNMSHQLNNPLTGIRSMARILSQNPELEELSEDFKEVEKATARAQKIIRSLIVFSQNREDSEKQNFDLNQAVRGALLLLKAMTSGIHLKIKLFPEPLEARGDFSLFQQVVYNLILNSCQAFKERKKGAPPLIEISTEKKIAGKAPDKAPDRAIVQIRDNGPGIPEGHIKKIFQPLWTTKKPGEGTGLGLSLARRFVEESGGKLFVRSELNQFSCFSIEFPLSSASGGRR